MVIYGYYTILKGRFYMNPTMITDVLYDSMFHPNGYQIISLDKQYDIGYDIDSICELSLRESLPDLQGCYLIVSVMTFSLFNDNGTIISKSQMEEYVQELLKDLPLSVIN